MAMHTTTTETVAVACMDRMRPGPVARSPLAHHMKGLVKSVSQIPVDEQEELWKQILPTLS